MTFQRIFLLLTLAFTVSLSSFVAAATLVSKVDRATLSIDETVQLNITFSGANTNQSPNLNLLNSDFEVLSSNQSTMMRTYNGRVTTSTEWTVILGPKRTGKLIIPSFNVDGTISDALEITVTSSQPIAAGQQRDISIETIVSKDSVYVQEQIKLTHRLAFDSSINIDQLDAEPLVLDNAVIEKLPDTKYQKNINGRTYLVFEYSYAIFPQASGEIVIPSLRWNLRIAKSNRRSFFDNMGNYELKRQRTDEKTIAVKPKPIIFPADKPWLPAENLVLQESWSQDPSSFKLGEPLTRTVIVQANGLTSSQLPQFTQEPNTNDIKFYADQPVLKDDQKETGVISQRIESAAIVAAKTGELTIPGEEIPWWNTKTDRLEFLYIEPRVINVASSSSNSGTGNLSQTQTNTTNTDSANEIPVLPTNSKSLQIWQALTLFFASLSIVLAYFAFFKSAQSTTREANNSSEIKLFEATEIQAWNFLSRHLSNKDLPAARKQLIVWFSVLHTTPINSIDEIIDGINDKNLSSRLKSFDETLYGNTNNEESMQTLLSELTQYRKIELKKTKNTKADKATLTGLHPI